MSKWIGKALGKGKRGTLRARMRQVGALKGKGPIPLDALKRAAKGAFGPVTAKRARLALTLRKFR